MIAANPTALSQPRFRHYDFRAFPGREQQPGHWHRRMKETAVRGNLIKATAVGQTEIEPSGIGGIQQSKANEVRRNRAIRCISAVDQNGISQLSEMSCVRVLP